MVLAAGFGSPGNAAELNEPIKPLPALKFDARKIELGRKLFVDARLSQDGAVSCASCHDFSRGGADPRPRSIGVRGEIGGANAPTVFNSGLNFRQTWNGSGASLEDFLERLIKNPKVFDANWSDVVVKLRHDAALSDEFQSAYAAGITDKTAIDAIATFVRSLITPSRFDRYLRGDAGAISTEEMQGYARFKSYGCVACHQGVNVGGKNKVSMSALRSLMESLGHTDVTTYIQSGNVVFTAGGDVTPQSIERAIQRKFGLDVTVVLRTRAALKKIVKANPFSGVELSKEPIRARFPTSILRFMHSYFFIAMASIPLPGGRMTTIAPVPTASPAASGSPRRSPADPA